MVHSECTIPFLRKKRLASSTPWISMGFLYFKISGRCKKVFNCLSWNLPAFFVLAPSVFPGALETRPGAGTLHVQGPGSSMQDGKLSQIEVLEIMEILLVGKGYRPKENKPKMKLPLGQRVKFWSTDLCHIELRYCSSLKSDWVARFFLAFQKRNIFVLNIPIYRFERGVDVTKAPAVLKEYHSARDPTLPFFQVGHGTVRVP